MHHLDSAQGGFLRSDLLEALGESGQPPFSATAPRRGILASIGPAPITPFRFISKPCLVLGAVPAGLLGIQVRRSCFFVHSTGLNKRHFPFRRRYVLQVNPFEFSFLSESLCATHDVFFFVLLSYRRTSFFIPVAAMGRDGAVIIVRPALFPST